MPKSWYIYSENKIDYENDSPEEIERKKLYQKICAHKKPYFFSYNYTHLRTEYNTYMANVDAKAYSMFQMSYLDLVNKENKTEQENQFVNWALNKMPLDASPSVMNRLCWNVEGELDGLELPHKEKFDYSMIKSGYAYSYITYKEIEKLHKQYKVQMSEMAKKKKTDYYTQEAFDNDDECQNIDQVTSYFKEKCEEICPNCYELCDILVDMCYRDRASKDIVWYVSGDIIIDNLLKNNNYNLYYPEKTVSCSEFECGGIGFVMKKLKIGGEEE